ncbi:hypothetical protein [Paenibacillus thermotolerans]|uniref:hypothetical protein n=1 Tax=Paenibacillus thermotolerans TaxID=3027807 RepID=UPI0023685A51|nr:MULTISPECIES: hypothetical protein [unclassified Paenibacillus]
MAFSSDSIVLLLVIVGFCLWGLFALRRWLRERPEVPVPRAGEGSLPEGEAVDLLREYGYAVIHGKVKVPVTVHKDEEVLASSLFVDYFAEKDNRTYAVKLSRTRKPLDTAAGSAIREALLVYALLYDNTAGVLYVDLSNRKVHKIRFELEL